MDFNFIPYRLSGKITHYKNALLYMGDDNGIDFYKDINPNNHVLNIPVDNTNLYFHEGRLITGYVHLSEDHTKAPGVAAMLTDTIQAKPVLFKTNTGLVHGWHNEKEFLGLVNDMQQYKLYIYHSLRQYNVFENRLL